MSAAVTHQILVLNGPNLNLLGGRQPEVYGTATLDDIMEQVVERGASLDASVQHAQSNVEGELVNLLHEARGWAQGVVFNPGAYTHYSYALRDAITAVELPVVETHLSNVAAREEFRHRSVLAPVCIGVVAGFGAASYLLALDGLVRYLNAR